MAEGNRYKWLSRSVIALKDIWKKVVQHAIYSSDEAKYKDAQARINKLMYFDDLTGLPNKICLQEKLERSIRDPEANHSDVIVFIFHIENFKITNSVFDYNFGDTLLKEVAENLKSYSHLNEGIFRLSIDEFAMLPDNIDNSLKPTEIAEQILDILRKPLEIGGKKFYIHVNMGIAVYPNDGVNAETLIKNAIMAMHKAKDSGIDNYCFFSPLYYEEVFKKVVMENDLRSAVERKEFIIHYQPIIDAMTNRTICLEALIRWKHPKRGLILPDEFIPAAEKTGMIVSIGEWVISETCRQMKVWIDMGFTSLHLSVNVSAIELHQNGFPDIIRGALRNTGFDARYLELEITERVAMSDLSVTRRALESLTKNGLSISLDDFGRGYSSLEYLIHLPIKSIKIDKSFIKKMMSEVKIQKIINYVIFSAHSLGFSVTAEGVESMEQYHFLKECKCDRIQGYFFSKPLPSDEMLEYLEGEVKEKIV